MQFQKHNSFIVVLVLHNLGIASYKNVAILFTVATGLH